MNKQPVYYLQTDARWKSKPYRVSGETATIGGSGCGPSCAAMLIETLTGKTYTPEDACNWSMAHGYKALNQGTYYSYFKPQFAEFGIGCEQLNNVSLYGNPTAATHAMVEQLLQDGWYIIACMGPGTWTKSGHFVVLWWEEDKMRINDPASTAEARINGDISTFKRQVKYYWKVDARSHNMKPLDITPMNATGTVTATMLNVRSGPETLYSVLGGLTKGCVVPITGSCHGWYRIQFGNVDSAWVSGQYIKLAAQAAKQEEDDMDVSRFKELWQEMRRELQDNDASAYSQEAREWAVNAGLITGGDASNFNGMWEDVMTREQLVTVLHRFAKQAGLA